MHICVSKLTTIGSDNGLSPGRRWAVIWTNAGILFVGPFWTNLSDTITEIQTFFTDENVVENVVCEMAAIFSRTQCVRLVCYHPHIASVPVDVFFYFVYQPTGAVLQVPLAYNVIQKKTLPLSRSRNRYSMAQSICTFFGYIPPVHLQYRYTGIAF